MTTTFLFVTVLAPVCAFFGYFLVTRNDVFAADAFGHLGFVGILVALVLGFDPHIGVLVVGITAACVIGLLGDRVKSDTTIGILLNLFLGIGVLFLSIFTSQNGSASANVGSTVFFGSFFHVSIQRIVQTWIVCFCAVVLLLVLQRPLLFATFDPKAAVARRVPVRFLKVAYLILTAVVVAEAIQAVGALLVLGLLVTPAATAQMLVLSPVRTIWLGAGIATCEAWGSMALARALPEVPPVALFVGITTAFYLIVWLYQKIGRTVFVR